MVDEHATVNAPAAISGATSRDGDVDHAAAVPPTRFDTTVLRLLFALCLGWAAYHATVGFGFPISDQHGFRQAQTAITIDTFLRGGPLLRYETPVLGVPWAIPFELPLYQWITAVLCLMTGLAVIQAGRIVSEAFF